jgi:transposase-like protein
VSRPSKYSPELREPAVRMVFEHTHEHASQWATMRSVAEKLGCTVEALAAGCARRSTTAASRLV